MRLTPQQTKAIILAITPFLEGHKAELRLYGSRIKDNLKGGDIDLLLISEHSDLATELRTNKHYILSAVKKNIGDQKIDLLIASNNALEHDVFLKMIYPESLVLKQW